MEKKYNALQKKYGLPKLEVIDADFQISSIETKKFILKEVGKGVYDPVFYLPKEDILIKLELEPKRQSHCPIKGDATYWNVESDFTKNYFAWSYEEPLPRSNKINGYIAFNLEYITLISEPI